MNLRNTFFFSIILFFATVFLPCRLFGQLQQSKFIPKIDALVKSYAAIKQFNGNVLVQQKGKVIFSKSYGMADMELNVPNERQTKFRIGSVTKQFTAVLVMLLRQEGKIDLDSSVAAYLPWYPVMPGRKIKIRHLLSHSSGLNNYTERTDFYTRLACLNIPAKQFGMQYCVDTTLLFEPGSRFHYCNTDYYLLGLVIELITGKNYAEVLSENILQRTGMQNTGIDSLASILPGRAKGYEYRYFGYENADPINMATSTYAAGAMYSTVDDLLRWQTALRGDKLLTAESRQLFFTPAINNHAFGLYINKMKNGKTAIGHPGGISGFSSFLITFPEDSITIILLDNTASGRRGDLDNTSYGIYLMLTGQPYKFPKAPLPTALTETYLRSGVTKMLQQYEHDKNDSTYDLSKMSSFLNNFGYTLLTAGKVKESLQVLKFAAEESPQNANTLDSYAEALKTDGQIDLAIEYYNKLLVLHPNDERVKQEIKDLQLLKK